MHGLNTLFIGRNYHHLPSVNSTNEHALSLLSKSKPAEGTVISTSNQWAGRGQIGSKWESEPGKNVALSIILYPNFLLAINQFLLNQAISIAVNSMVEHHFPKRCKIKWPNDVYIHDKKVAGILIQNSISGNKLKSSVVGIGININQERFSSEALNPTSFLLEKGEKFEIPQLISQLCQAIESWYLKLKSGKTLLIQQAYLDNLYRFQKNSIYKKTNGQIFEGKISGISESGQLKIATEDGVELFGLKEIQFLNHT